MVFGFSPAINELGPQLGDEREINGMPLVARFTSAMWNPHHMQLPHVVWQGGLQGLIDAQERTSCTCCIFQVSQAGSNLNKIVVMTNLYVALKLAMARPKEVSIGDL